MTPRALGQLGTQGSEHLRHGGDLLPEVIALYNGALIRVVGVSIALVLRHLLALELGVLRLDSFEFLPQLLLGGSHVLGGAGSREVARDEPLVSVREDDFALVNLLPSRGLARHPNLNRLPVDDDFSHSSLPCLWPGNPGWCWVTPSSRCYASNSSLRKVSHSEAMLSSRAFCWKSGSSKKRSSSVGSVKASSSRFIVALREEGRRRQVQIRCQPLSARNCRSTRCSNCANCA